MATKSCYDRALGLLARRSHFRRELAAKLGARGYDEDEIDGVLDRLEEKSFLDDARTAREFVQHRLREPVGRRRILADLGRRGAPQDAAQDALDALYPNDEEAVAAEAAERWQRRATGRRSREALGRHLERQGFSSGVIFPILDQHRFDP